MSPIISTAQYDPMPSLVALQQQDYRPSHQNQAWVWVCYFGAKANQAYAL